MRVGMGFGEMRSRALEYRRRDVSERNTAIVLVILIVIVYALTIIFKGWDNTFLFGLIGLAFLTFWAVMKHRSVKDWDRKIERFERDIKDFERRYPL